MVKYNVLFFVALGMAPLAIADDTQVSSSDWPSYNRTLSGDRYSALAAITPQNAATLRLHCTAPLDEVTSMQSGPLVIGGVMYVTTATATYALDAANCTRRWKHTYVYEKPAFDLQVNRGLAYADGRLFRGAQDGSVYAVDATTGAELWRIKPWDGKKGETVSAAPVTWHGLVFIGNGMGDFAGVTGRVYALRAESGEEVWHFDTVARTAEGRASWGKKDRLPSGGGTWTSYSLDERTGRLFVPVANPAPDYLLDARPGSNLYTNSVIELDALTGELKGYHPLVKQDFHDWDVGATPALITTRQGKQLAATAVKDGYLYGLQPSDGSVLYKTQTTTIDNAAAPITAQGTRFCPGSSGGTEWNGPAYSPPLNLLFVNAVDWCTTVRIAPALNLKPPPPGSPWGGSADPDAPFGSYEDAQKTGWLTAVDADDGSVRWKYHAGSPMLAGLSPTAGGTLATAEEAGIFLIFEAATGKVVFRYDVGQPIGGGVITYAVAGAELVAVATGMSSHVWHTSTGPARVLVFGL